MATDSVIKKPSTSNLKPILLQIYRLGALTIIVFLVHAHRTKLAIESGQPVTAAEVRPYYPAARELRLNEDRFGLDVLDGDGRELGYVLRTSPVCNRITGYAGPTDTLIAFSPEWKVLGVRIRGSADTISHVADISKDPTYLKTWDGMTRSQVAAMDVHEAKLEGVSGATLTSMAIAYGIIARAKAERGRSIDLPPMRFGMRDAGLIAVLATGLLIAFTPARGRRWLRRLFQFTVIGYVGFINGDLLAQSLMHGWTISGTAWRMAPGAALMLAAALLVPWTTRRPLYCQYICPHGAAQELLDRISPKHLRIHLHTGLARGLRWLPFLLLALALGTTMLVIPLDLAGIEPFDAYVFRSAGWATLAIAGIGLVASLFVPMAYCKFGCPTGALLEFLRSHGRSDSFGKRDVAAAFLVLWTGLLMWQHDMIWSWIAGI